MFVEERKLAGGERGRWVGVVEGKRDGGMLRQMCG